MESTPDAPFSEAKCKKFAEEGTPLTPKTPTRFPGR